MRTTAHREGDEYVLEGSKRFITNAAVADLYTVFAKTDADARHAGISAFVLEAGTPGFEVARLEPKMGISGSTTGELTFEGARLPASNLLGEEGEGFKIAMRILDRSRPGVAAQGLGIAQGATDYAPSTHGRERRWASRSPSTSSSPRSSRTWRRAPRARGLLYRFGRMVDEGAAEAEPRRRRRWRSSRTDAAMWVDRGRAGPRRLRLHQGIPGRAHDATRRSRRSTRARTRSSAS